MIGFTNPILFLLMVQFVAKNPYIVLDILKKSRKSFL